MKPGISIPTAQPATHMGFLHSMQRFASVIAAIGGRPWGTSLKLRLRTSASCSGIVCRGIFIRSFFLSPCRRSISFWSSP